jgi:hypothetical protein
VGYAFRHAPRHPGFRARLHFKILQSVPPSYTVELGEHRIRIYRDMAINSGSYTLSEDRDGTSIIRPAGSALCTGIATDAGLS